MGLATPLHAVRPVPEQVRVWRLRHRGRRVRASPSRPRPPLTPHRLAREMRADRRSGCHRLSGGRLIRPAQRRHVALGGEEGEVGRSHVWGQLQPESHAI